MLMKYLVRVIKYFVYLTVILTLFIAVLIAFKMVGTSVDEIFRDGARSLWQIAGIIAVFAAVYPAMGFTRRGAIVPGSYARAPDLPQAFPAAAAYADAGRPHHHG